MSTEPPKPPENPWRLNGSRTVLLIMGVLLLIIVLSTLFGGLGNYQQLREAAQDAKSEQRATSP